MHRLTALALVTLLTSPAPAAAQSLEVSVEGRTTTFSAADLAAMPRVEVAAGGLVPSSIPISPTTS